jgi:hypothetical protein
MAERGNALDAVNAVSPVILVCGSRKFRNWALVTEVVGDFDPETVVVEGGAAGPDTFARKAAHARGLHVASVPALWDAFGKAAGFRRNRAMLRLGVTMVVAFWDGKSSGTGMMIDFSLAAGIPVTVYAEDGSSRILVK